MGNAVRIRKTNENGLVLSPLEAQFLPIGESRDFHLILWSQIDESYHKQDVPSPVTIEPKRTLFLSAVLMASLQRSTSPHPALFQIRVASPQSKAFRHPVKQP